MRARQSVYIERLPDDVFAFVADHSNDLMWRSELRASCIEGDVKHGVGARIRETVIYQGRVSDVVLEITEIVPGERICYRAHGRVRAHGCYEVRPEGRGTRFTVSATIELKGPAALLERFIHQAVERAAETDLGRLKALLEAHLLR